MKRNISIFFLLFVVLSAYSQESKNTKVLIETTLGNMVIELYNETPLHRDNFIKLVQDHYFDNQLFHRVIKGFMVQGGDPNSIGAAKGEMLGMSGPGYDIPAEINPKYYHKKGTIAAARKSDVVNPKRESSGSQFYIVQGQVFSIDQLNALVQMNKHATFTQKQIEDYTSIGGTPHLDNEYTVFGEVIEGLNVLDAIANVPVDSNNRPNKDISYKMTILK
jgi:cyclophilin family peptidyl-prolyl cis-trans isomerase